MASNAKLFPKMQPHKRGVAHKFIHRDEYFHLKNGDYVSTYDYYLSCVKRSDYTGVSREWLRKIAKLYDKTVMCGDYGRKCPTCYPLKGSERLTKFRYSKSVLKKAVYDDYDDC